MDKPGDFFVGVSDLLGVFLPGAVVTFVAMRAEQSLNPPADLFGLLKLKDASGYTAFLVSSFLLGHLVDMIGASFLNRIYDLLYADFMRYQGGLRGWLRGTPRRLAVFACDWYNFHAFDGPAPGLAMLPKGIDPLLDAANALSHLRPRGEIVYAWCRASLQLRSPQALQGPDRTQATSRFFRGLVVVAVSFAGLFCLVPSFRANYIGSAARDFLWMASCLVLMAVAFLRYSELRWREVRDVYRLYVILRHSEANGLVSGAQQPEIE